MLYVWVERTPPINSSEVQPEHRGKPIYCTADGLWCAAMAYQSRAVTYCTWSARKMDQGKSDTMLTTLNTGENFYCNVVRNICVHPSFCPEELDAKLLALLLILVSLYVPSLAAILKKHYINTFLILVLYIIKALLISDNICKCETYTYKIFNYKFNKKKTQILL